MTTKLGTHIRTDKDTLLKLRQIAGDKSLGAYLRDLANGVEQAPVPVNELEAIRNTTLKKITDLENKLDRFLKAHVEQLEDFTKDRIRTECILGMTISAYEKGIKGYKGLKEDILAQADIQYKDELARFYKRWAKNIKDDNCGEEDGRQE